MLTAKLSHDKRTTWAVALALSAAAGQGRHNVREKEARRVRVSVPPLVRDRQAGLKARLYRHLLDVAGRRLPQHRLVGVERVLDLAIEIELVLRLT
jgi:hypothetical protein